MSTACCSSTRSPRATRSAETAPSSESRRGGLRRDVWRDALTRRAKEDLAVDDPTRPGDPHTRAAAHLGPGRLAFAAAREGFWRERTMGLEPTTLGLGSQCSTN